VPTYPVNRCKNPRHGLGCQCSREKPRNDAIGEIQEPIDDWKKDKKDKDKDEDKGKKEKE
jgi:hypothetical protein